MRKLVKDHQVNLTWDDPSFGRGSYESKPKWQLNGNGDQREENQTHGQILICILST
jgi:hypothetical protein